MRMFVEIPKAIIVGGIGSGWVMTRNGVKVDVGNGGLELACAVFRERREGPVEVSIEGDVYEDIAGNIQEFGPTTFLS